MLSLLVAHAALACQSGTPSACGGKGGGGGEGEVFPLVETVLVGGQAQIQKQKSSPYGGFIVNKLVNKLGR